MKSLYGISKMANKEQFEQHLISKSNLAFEVENSIYIGFYTNIFIKIDMKLSASEYKIREGCIFSTQDPYFRLNGDEEEKLEVSKIYNDIKILGTEYLKISKNHVISLNGGQMNLFGIDS